MDSNEIVKHAPGIIGALGASDFARRVFGPSLDELGEYLRERAKKLLRRNEPRTIPSNPVAETHAEIEPTASDLDDVILNSATFLYNKEFRERLCSVFEKASSMAAEAGFEAQRVPAKLLLPILQGAAVEDDADLHEMWAALLANAASPDSAQKVRPSFIAILREMAPDEAALLNWMYGFFETTAPDVETPLSTAYRTLGFDASDFLVCLDSLQASLLVQDSRSKYGPEFYAISWKNAPVFFISALGSTFMKAARPPALKE